MCLKQLLNLVFSWKTSAISCFVKCSFIKRKCGIITDLSGLSLWERRCFDSVELFIFGMLLVLTFLTAQVEEHNCRISKSDLVSIVIF